MDDVLRFSALEVHPIKHYGDIAVICADEDADHFSLYGVLPNAYVCVGDFSSRENAELVAELLGF